MLGRLPREAADQLGARVHVELAVDASEVELDRLVREEEGGADLTVGHPPGDMEDDLELLGGELLFLPRFAAPKRLAARPELVDSPIGSALAADQGRSAALLIALTCLATGGIWAVGSLFAPAPPRLPVAARIAFVAVLVALLGVGVAAANPRERFDRFREIPPGLGEASVQEHLLSGSGNGRWQLWEAAYDEFERHPLEGRGAGTYEATWSQHGTLPLFVRDAHSLYFETLAELGVVGLLLLVGALVGGFTAAVSRMLKADGDDRSALAALSAVVAAFAFEAGFDWMWELTAVTVVAFAALGLLAGPATALRAGRTAARATLLRAAAFAAAFVILLAQSVSLLADLRVRESRAAAERADYPEAVSDAQAARSLAPWFASPRLQLALVQELAGDVPPCCGSNSTRLPSRSRTAVAR